jgi:hypothetical protein
MDTHIKDGFLKLLMFKRCRNLYGTYFQNQVIIKLD